MDIGWMKHVSSVQSLSHVQLLETPWTAARQASLSITTSRSLPKLISIESVMPSNHLILCCPLLLPPSIFPSIRVFSNESVLCIRWPKFWRFSFSISPSNEYSGLISFRMDQFDLLAAQGTLKSLLQHHSSEASILRLSAFFIVKLFHPYVTTGKTIGIHRRTVQRSLIDPDNHDGVVTNQEPDILECEVRWALVSTTMNKASGGDGTPAELFRALNNDVIKVLHSICQQIWKTQQ